ncbi:MAG: sigma factor-like helix-turn-helix DNA-binding protein [Patescibacteria group bacterium]|nr:sigma factor-like helix-turn-helix DNA-binding protein [Patescibacteria group bacterium]
MEGGEYIIIHTQPRKHPNFGNLTEKTKKVHVSGHLFLWIVKLILSKCPNLESIQVVPKRMMEINKSHKRLCDSRGVKIDSGYYKPDLAWDAGESRLSSYKLRRLFFQKLAGKQKALFNELLSFGFEEAIITARYFCLNKENFLCQRELGMEFGYLEKEKAISRKVNAVISYLDETFSTSRVSMALACSIKRRVEKLRKTKRSKSDFRRLLGRYRISKLPKGFPITRLKIYSELLKARKDGRMNSLELENPKWHKVINLRFGLGSEESYLALEKVGNIVGVSRERVRQIEHEALKKLKIIK